mgnify:CR=1 FL=1
MELSQSDKYLIVVGIIFCIALAVMLLKRIFNIKNKKSLCVNYNTKQQIFQQPKN